MQGLSNLAAHLISEGFVGSRLVNNSAGFAFTVVHGVSQLVHVITYSYSWDRV